MFQNREEAGLLLADKLQNHKGSKETIVLAIPRGGVIVGKRIADSLRLPLSVIVVKKIGAPHNPELAIGAVAPNGVKMVDKELVGYLGITREYLDEEIAKKKKEIEEREKKFRIKNLEFRIKKKELIILVDDGVATGATTLTAIKYIRQQITENSSNTLGTGEQQIAKIILAVPVIAKDTYDRLKSEVDEVISLDVSESFQAVGQFYREFPQVTDEEVVRLLTDNK